MFRGLEGGPGRGEGHMAELNVSIRRRATFEPLPLPHCSYPSAADAVQHGVQRLPATLPLVDFERARPHRSPQYATVPAGHLTSAQIIRLAEVVGKSFARREPQCRHLQPARILPAALRGATHTDPFGRSAFGLWDKERLLY